MRVVPSECSVASIGVLHVLFGITPGQWEQSKIYPHQDSRKLEANGGKGEGARDT